MARFPRLQPVQPSAAGLLFCIRSHRWPKDDSGESLLCQASSQMPKPPLSVSSSEKQAPKAGLAERFIKEMPVKDEAETVGIGLGNLQPVIQGLTPVEGEREERRAG